MTTAVVVTSIVTTNLGEAGFVDHVLGQIRRNDRNLLNRLNKVDGDARVVTAILDVDEFMAYLQEVFREREVVESAEWDFIDTAERAPINGEDKPVSKTTVVTAEMNELEFMDYTLGQLRQDNVPSLARFSDDALDEIEEERIGEAFSRTPFLY